MELENFYYIITETNNKMYYLFDVDTVNHTVMWTPHLDEAFEFLDRNDVDSFADQYMSKHSNYHIIEE